MDGHDRAGEHAGRSGCADQRAHHQGARRSPGEDAIRRPRRIDLADVVADLVAQYSLSEAEARRDVDAFVHSLVTDELIVANDAPASGEAESAELVAPSEYSPLTLERFTDLADLILLDPVHDVTEAGWPHATS